MMLQNIKKIFPKKLSLKEQVYSTSRLAFLLSAHISLMDSLTMLRDQGKKKWEIKMFDDIISDISRGVFLGASLAAVEPRWNTFAVHIITTGEMTGTLTSNLQYVALELKKRQELKQKIIAALTYPLCIGVATIGVTGMITLYILPKITPIFISINSTLPLSTKILLFVHHSITHYGIYIVLLFVLCTAVIILFWKKYKIIRFGFVSFCLRLPLVGNMIRNYEMSQTFRTLHILLKTSMSLPQALIQVSLGCVACVYEREYMILSETVTKGMGLSTGLKDKESIFPVMVAHMVSVGESSGTIAEVSLYISEYYEKELDQTIKNLSSLLEPILMIVMGVVVGFVAISVISPIYEITQNIKR